MLPMLCVAPPVLREDDERRGVRVVAHLVRATNLVGPNGAMGGDTTFGSGFLVEVVHLGKRARGRQRGRGVLWRGGGVCASAAAYL